MEIPEDEGVETISTSEGSGRMSRMILLDSCIGNGSVGKRVGSVMVP